ncbi:hypothetical protein Pmani_012011 [Petrolisthes manimaculis]|uniref:Uncharacterized protein n=1 Tax=Petrolisthes manimaculis TaxID=1843537 RepID=A0AAE1UDQ6_9EUCA|nr:hypothetical protein Pmani_012011 [Petrolisthes manimaculis]
MQKLSSGTLEGIQVTSALSLARRREPIICRGFRDVISYFMSRNQSATRVEAPAGWRAGCCGRVRVARRAVYTHVGYI